MKILIPILGFGRAGGYRVLSKLADELIHLGHSVDFLCPDGGDQPYYPTIARIWWIDKSGSLSTVNNNLDKKNNVFSIQQKLTRALRKLSKNSYDVIIANHSLTTFPIKRAGLQQKTLYYVQAYEPEFYHKSGIKNKVLSRLSKRSYQMKLFTVVNGKTYLDYKEIKASRTLYPGIDLSLFHRKDNNTPCQTDRPIIIGTIGRPEPAKGTSYIIEAFQKLRKKYSNIQLHVAFGNPSDFSENDDIYCFQPDGDERLANFYRSLDYYICAGYIQMGAFHYPVVEAMSCGIPVITTHYYPANETNAWLIKELQDSEAIVTQFEMAQNNASLKQKKIEQALTDVQQFDWKLVGKRLDGFIRELAGTPVVNEFNS